MLDQENLELSKIVKGYVFCWSHPLVIVHFVFNSKPNLQITMWGCIFTEILFWQHNTCHKWYNKQVNIHCPLAACFGVSMTFLQPLFSETKRSVPGLFLLLRLCSQPLTRTYGYLKVFHWHFLCFHSNLLTIAHAFFDSFLIGKGGGEILRTLPL